MEIVITKGRDCSENWEASWLLSADPKDIIIRAVILPNLSAGRIHPKTAHSAPAAVLRSLLAQSSVWNAVQR